MSSGGGVVGIALSLFATNILYIIITLVLAWVLGASPVDMFAGAFAGVATTAVVAWVSIGAIIGIADFYAIFSFLSSTGGSQF